MSAALFLAGCASAPEPETVANPRVQLVQGMLEGRLEDGIAVFRGIPFAGDAGGDNRWRPPTPAPAWTDVRDAGAHGPICPQATTAPNRPPASWLEGLAISEDCLNLAIYSPGLSTQEKWPVMVWIHGGFARIGAGARYDGAPLASRGVVVVTINYRLDRLGLFAHPAISAEQPGALLGNYGLMDAQAALAWVQENIGAFGGDAGNVTIFGQSSGGVAVSALMGSPLSKGLFHRAIAQSGVMADIDHERHLARDRPGNPSLENEGITAASALLPGLDPAAVDAAALRAISWEDLIAYTASQPGNALVPVVDGHILPDTVARSFAGNRQQPVPFMLGSTDWEQSLYQYFTLPAAVLGTTTPEEAARIYPGLEDKALIDQWVADTSFHAPARFLANAHARHGHPAFVYTFTHRPAGRDNQPGAAHSDEVPYLFNLRGEAGWAHDNPDEQAMAASMLDYWVAFARDGRPDTANQPPWPRWQDGGGARLQVLDVPPTAGEDAWAPRMEFHLERYDRLLDASGSD